MRVDVAADATARSELTSLAAGLCNRLSGHRRAKVSLNQLTAMAVDADPALATSVDRRPRLAEAVDELVDHEIVRLPTAGAFDKTARPHLPRFVWLDRPAPISRRVPGHTLSWRPELAWAAELSLTEEHVELLSAVNRFLRDDGYERPVVPVRERSLELLGNEKRLEVLTTGTLFAPGRLTVGLLRCRIVRAPFVFREIGPGDGLLVIENHTTFDSVVRSGIARTGDIGFVAYGAGRQFEASVEFVRELPRPITAISYFGDLDDPGLSIAVNAARNADRAGLPPITPAEQLYSLLLEHGRPAPWERTTSASRARRLAAWLPGPQRGPVTDLLVRGERLAQEAVGVEALASLRDL